MVNFYRRLTPGIAAVLEPLTTALKGGKKTLQCSPHLDAAFNKSKQVLTHAVPLGHPAPDANIAVATDASDTHIGGALHQKVRGSWQPLGFFSRKLNVAETKYSTFDRELLAAAQAIRHFRHILEGREAVDRPQTVGHRNLLNFRTLVGQTAETFRRHRRIHFGS
jgi:hypothetical protein